MRVAFTGHRPDKLRGKHDEIIDAIHAKLFSLFLKREGWPATIKFDDDLVIVGMARGVDMIAGGVARKMQVPYEAAVPFYGQQSGWDRAEQAAYDVLIDDAKSVHVCTEGSYKPWFFQVRNEYMVDNCDLVLAVWDGTAGGTANCVKYAQKVGRPILFLNWHTWQWEEMNVPPTY